MSHSLNGLIPQFRPWAQELIYVADANRLQPRVTSTRRSHSQQARLYRNYLAGNSQFPAAPPGTSAHEFGYALDMVVNPMDALPSLGALWRSWGGFWGPDDPIHFEYPGFPHSQVKPSSSILRQAAELFIPTKLTTAPNVRGYRDIAAQLENLFQ